MDQVCFALPLLEGQTEDACAFMFELRDQRSAEFDESEQRIDIVKESWYLQTTPRGDLLIGYMESPDFAEALRRFAASKNAFDSWFKRRLFEVTGVDLNNPPSGPLSEQLSSYEVLRQAASSIG
jgi:hypothetical protein